VASYWRDIVIFHGKWRIESIMSNQQEALLSTDFENLNLHLKVNDTSKDVSNGRALNFRAFSRHLLPGFCYLNM
jgi:ribosomal protein S15P/S13E